MTKWIRNCLLAGLVVWLPLLLTAAVLHFIVGILNSIVDFLPKQYQPQDLFGVNVPGLGILLSLILLLFTGMLVSNFLGAKILSIGEKILDKIPFVNSVYKSSKQVIHALFSSNGKSFRQVVMVEYPRKDIWSIGFLTGSYQEDKQAVFIPTTPNPTSGFLLLVNSQDIKILDMTVDAALKYIISLGVMQPISKN